MTDASRPFEGEDEAGVYLLGIEPNSGSAGGYTVNCETRIAVDAIRINGNHFAIASGGYVETEADDVMLLEEDNRAVLDLHYWEYGPEDVAHTPSDHVSLAKFHTEKAGEGLEDLLENDPNGSVVYSIERATEIARRTAKMLEIFHDASRSLEGMSADGDDS